MAVLVSLSFKDPRGGLAFAYLPRHYRLTTNRTGTTLVFILYDYTTHRMVSYLELVFQNQ